MCLRSNEEPGRITLLLKESQSKIPSREHTQIIWFD
jgi:hypothetical protein